MLEITNQGKFERTVSEAICATAENASDERNAKRGTSAIEKVVDLVEAQSELINWYADQQSVLVWNQESNKIKEANGICQCPAYERRMACKHRAGETAEKILRHEVGDN